MITAFDIEKFGSFNDFNWSSDIGNYNSGDWRNTFQKINIIYGRNYSGKTTLSRILGCLQNKELHKDYQNSSFKIIINKKVLTEKDLQNDYNIHIYNSDFVKKNLKWFYDKEGIITPFTIIGKENIEIQKQIDELNEEIVKAQNKFDKSKEKVEIQSNKIKEKENKLTQNLTDEARNIKHASAYYNQVTYDRSKLKNKLSKLTLPVTLLSEDEIIKQKKIIMDSNKEKLNLMNRIELPNVDSIEKLNDLLQKKITINNPIIELLNDSCLEKWVREGKTLNKGRETCAFCGSPLNKNIWEKINNHFNDESEKLIIELEGFEKYITRLENEILSLKLINSNDIMAFLKEKLEEKVNIFCTCKEKLLVYYKTIYKVINEKKEKITDDFKIEYISFVKINNIISDINELIKEHNNYCENIEQKKQNARNTLLDNKEKEIFKNLKYTETCGEITEEKETLKKIDKEFIKEKENLEKLKQKKEDCEKKLKSETRSCELINKYLNDFFGRDDLELRFSENFGKKGFSIYRQKNLAKNLSEGEARLISFCYFLAQISDFENDENLILWIDDPISSLDNNQIYHTFGMISSIVLKYKYKQIFISTHNLDFLRCLTQLPKPDSASHINYFLVERVMRKNDCTSRIIKMPEYLKKFTTEFHYLFSLIYKMNKNTEDSLANNYSQIYNLPNNIRKFLEYYIFYRYPNNDKPLNNLQKIFSQEEYYMINRLINDSSHLKYIDKGWHPVDIPNVKDICKIIIEKMKELDNEQFKALENAINGKFN